MERSISEEKADEISPFTQEIVEEWSGGDRNAAIFAKAPKFTRKIDPSEEYAFAIVKHRVVETIQGARTIGGSISVTARLSFGDRGECTKQWINPRLTTLREGNVVTLDEHLRVVDVFDHLLTFLDCIQKGYIVLTPGSDEVVMVPKKKEEAEADINEMLVPIEYMLASQHTFNPMSEHASDYSVRFTRQFSDRYCGNNWAVRRGLNVLCHDLEWEIEPPRGERDDDYYNTHRFDSLEEAIAAYKASMEKGEPL
jgi:hypothetical protein